MKLTLLNHSYTLKKTTNGKYYIVKAFTRRGYRKWQAGTIKNQSGIITF